MSDIDIINDKLKSLYGTNMYGQPNFRIVFSDRQTEVRYGEYHEFYGPIFIRTLTGFHERKKYPLVRERWIIERWYPSAYYERARIQLPKTLEGDYELIYIFEDKDSNPLPVVEWAASIACGLSLKGTHYSSGETSSFAERKSELKTEDEKQLKKEEDEIVDMVDTTPTELSLRYREGVTVLKDIK